MFCASDAGKADSSFCATDFLPIGIVALELQLPRQLSACPDTTRPCCAQRCCWGVPLLFCHQHPLVRLSEQCTTSLSNWIVSHQVSGRDISNPQPSWGSRDT